MFDEIKKYGSDLVDQALEQTQDYRENTKEWIKENYPKAFHAAGIGMITSGGSSSGYQPFDLFNYGVALLVTGQDMVESSEAEENPYVAKGKLESGIHGINKGMAIKTGLGAVSLYLAWGAQQHGDPVTADMLYKMGGGLFVSDIGSYIERKRMKGGLEEINSRIEEGEIEDYTPNINSQEQKDQ